MKHCYQEQSVETAKQALGVVPDIDSHGAINTPTINLTSFARLHMGFFDLNGGLGRKFGSIGLTLAEPSMQVTAMLSDEIKVSAASSVPLAVVQKATQICITLLNKLNVEGGLHLHLHSHIPSHAGLGSGTQMALSIGTVINRLYGLRLGTADIATLTMRGGRSGIGIAAFDVGGVLIDGGLATTELAKNQPQSVPPLLARYDWPEDWRIILILDKDGVGVHGKQEREAFKNLPAFPANIASDLCRQMLMQVMPAIVEHDLTSFGNGVQVLQAKIGDYFAPVQGGRYASQSVAAVLAYLANSGVACFGQSSWGPTGFAVCETLKEAESLVENLKGLFKNSGLTYLICSARNAGAYIDEESK